MKLNQEQNKEQPKVIKVKRKVNKTIDQDFLMYNSPEDEDYLRNVVKDNYSNTIYSSSEY